MSLRSNVLPGAVLLALLFTAASSVSAQPAATPASDSAASDASTSKSSAISSSGEPVKMGELVVKGTRASLISAIELKRDNLDIVDSIVASDINKLPDYNVTDALQRITGIQVLRDRGEGAGIAIRGLTQMETTLNGRETFTAGLAATGSASRTIDFADIPSEMIASINVYKTSSADHIEGGIGGLVDLQTRRPFDFKGFAATGSVRLIGGDLARKGKLQYSALASNRFKLKNGGELGALINVSYGERAWREDQKGTGNPAARTDIIPGQTITVQNSTSENTVFGKRRRTGVTGVLQWRPVESLEFYAEANYTRFITLQNTNQINATGGTTFVAGSPVLAPGTSDLQKITWTNASISVLSFARDTHDWTKQFGGGAIWRGENLTLKADLSYTKSYNDLFFSGPFFATTAAQFSQDLAGDVPATTVTGTNLNDPSIYRYTGIAYRYRPFYGELGAGTIDGTWKLNNRFLPTLLFGVRESEHKATNKPGLIFADFTYATGAGPVANTFPNLVTTNTYGFLPHVGATSIGSYMTGVLDPARDAVAYRALFGISTPIPGAASPLTTWNLKEKVDAAYLMGKFKTPNFPLDGNIGVRLVHTQEKVAGSQGTSAANAVPININSSYNSVLPSLNTRYTIHDGFFLRFAASKTLTRPDFGQLSPSIILAPNPINPALNQGGAGNPALHPIKSENLDVAVEKYFTPATSAYVTLFHKKVDGFIVNSAATETFDGQDYLVTRPHNANPATIEGAEVGYTQFFDFLPGELRGLGVQANYTYIKSNTPNATLGSTTPLPNLSKNSYNMIGMFENKHVSVRVAYNWRDKFLSGQANIANVGRIPFYTKAYGWMDASVIYHLNENLTLGVEGTNLLRTKRISYFGVTTRPQNVFINDRQVSFTATWRY